MARKAWDLIKRLFHFEKKARLGAWNDGGLEEMGRKRSGLLGRSICRRERSKMEAHHFFVLVPDHSRLQSLLGSTKKSCYAILSGMSILVIVLIHSMLRKQSHQRSVSWYILHNPTIAIPPRPSQTTSSSTSLDRSLVRNSRHILWLVVHLHRPGLPWHSGLSLQLHRLSTALSLLACSGVGLDTAEEVVSRTG